MNAPPDYLLLEHNLPSEWRVIDAGMVAQTFLNDYEQLVLQKRPITGLKAYQASQLYFQQHFKEPYLIGAFSELLGVEENSFWIVCSKLDLPESEYIYTHGLRTDYLAWWKWADQIWPVALNTMKLLHDKPMLPDHVLRNPKQVTMFKLLPVEYILSVLNSRGAALKSVPDFHFDSSWVASHGDLHASNIVYHKNSYRVIDWENFSLLPNYSDPSQFIVYLLSKTPPEVWKDFFWKYADACQDLTGLNSLQWATVLIEALLRETALWSEEHPDPEENNTFQENINGVKGLLNEL